jgi:hypothetical protein
VSGVQRNGTNGNEEENLRVRSEREKENSTGLRVKMMGMRGTREI